jgi:Truncated hemoglobins
MTAPRNLSDIEGHSDIVQIVDRFYAKVRADDLLGPIFDDIAKVNWEVHLPKLYAFWQTVLFGNGGFRGNPLFVHANLLPRTPMDWPRFQRWLDLFCATVDELYQGERAEHMKNAAIDMAHVIYSRINGVPDPRFDPSRLTPEQKLRYKNYRGEVAD